MEILAITIPIFIYVAMGYILKQKGVITVDIKNFLSKLVYYFAFPVLTFKSIVGLNFGDAFKLNLVANNLLVTSIVFAITLFLAFFIRDRRKRGAFHMSSFRSNQGYMGLPVINGFYDAGLTGTDAVNTGKAAIINGFDTPTAVILSVIALEIFKGGVKREKTKEGFWGTLAYHLVNLFVNIGTKMISVLINPFIISSFLGLILCFFKVPVLSVGILNQFLTVGAGMAFPLALISIGCSIEIRHLSKNIGLVLKASFVKLIAMPALAFVLAYYLFGFRGVDLGISVILCAMPSSVSSYVMAMEMEADEELSAATIGVTTIISVITISVIQYFLKVNFQV
jgi:hypothetical protein